MMGEALARRSRPVFVFVILLLLGATAMAESIRGTVTNATTGKPAAGAAVTLVDPMGGMAEVATTKADAQGRFTFNTPDAKGPQLARAERGGVNYFKMVPPGTASVDLSVYDAAPSVEGINGSADVVRMEAAGNQLQAVELFAIRNESNPPRTLASASTFAFTLPEGAQIDGAQAQAPNGQPISVTTNAAKEKNQYAFSFALKPGETRFQLAYHMPYNGKASFSPRLTRNFEHYVLVLPASMSFSPRDPKLFQAMANQPGSNVQVSLKAQSGQDLSYAISGTGAFPDDQDASGGGGTSGGASSGAQGDNGMGGGGATADSRPGGGLGRPIDAPDGLARYRWYIIGALLTVLVGGGIWTHERTKQEEAEDALSFAPVLPSAPRYSSADALASVPASVSNGQLAAQVATQPPSQLLLAALKEELFALEVERQQGKLSPEEYEKARAALEQTLQRALSRMHN
jgi:hypothetical protein